MTNDKETLPEGEDPQSLENTEEASSEDGVPQPTADNTPAALDDVPSDEDTSEPVADATEAGSADDVAELPDVAPEFPDDAPLPAPDGADEASARSGRKAHPRIAFRSEVESRSGVRTVYGVAALAFASLVLAVVGVATKLEALSLIGGYGVAFLGIGAAPLQLRTELDLWARLTAAVLIGFSVLLVVGGLMADVHGLWHPVAAAVIFGAAALALHLIGLRRAQIGLRYIRRQPAAQSTVGSAGVLSTIRTASLPARISLIATLVGTLLWLIPALLTHDPNPGFWGMLKTIGPFWYAGLALLMVALAVGRRLERCAAAAVFSFGLATTLTPALVYAAPREQTAGKQMQLTQYVLTHHSIHVTGGIYQAFSAMFSGMAWLLQLLHIHGLLGANSLFGVATYWPVLLVLMRVVELRFLAGRLLATTGRQWCAVMLVLLVDSLGADYYSPQSIGYILAIGVVAMAMNGLTPRPFGWRGTLCLLTLVGVALAPTHELSPYMAAGALLVLAIFGQAPFWTCVPIGLPALAWAGVVHKAIGQNFTFGALFDVSNFKPPTTVATSGLARLPIVGIQAHTLLLALLMLMALGAIGFFANIRKKWAWAYALCPVVGLIFIAINPYGNEGIFRSTLFAIPWMAILAMKMPKPSAALGFFARPIVVTVGVTLCLGALLATFVIAAYAMDGTNVLPRDNLAVADYLARQPSRNAFVLSVGGADNPADTVPFASDYQTLEWFDVVGTAPELLRLHPTSLDPIALADQYGLIAPHFGATSSSPLYVIWAKSAAMYAQAYGEQSPAEMAAWLRLLKTSPDWKLVKQRGDTYLFKLRYG